MKKDEKMRVITGVAVIILMIFGVFGFIYCYLFTSANSTALNGLPLKGKVMSVNTDNSLEVMYTAKSYNVYSVTIDADMVSADYKKGDTIPLLCDQKQSQIIYTKEQITRLKNFVMDFKVFCIIAFVVGCVLLKVVVIDWDKRFLTEEFKNSEKQAEVDGMVEKALQKVKEDEEVDLFSADEEVDLFDEDSEGGYQEQYSQQGQYNQQGQYSQQGQYNQQVYEKPKVMQGYPQPKPCPNPMQGYPYPSQPVYASQDYESQQSKTYFTDADIRYARSKQIEKHVDVGVSSSSVNPNFPKRNRKNRTI